MLYEYRPPHLLRIHKEIAVPCMCGQLPQRKLHDSDAKGSYSINIAGRVVFRRLIKCLGIVLGRRRIASIKTDYRSCKREGKM